MCLLEGALHSSNPAASGRSSSKCSLQGMAHTPVLSHRPEPSGALPALDLHLCCGGALLSSCLLHEAAAVRTTACWGIARARSPRHQGPKTFLQVAPGTVAPGTTWEVLTSVMPQADSPWACSAVCRARDMGTNQRCEAKLLMMTQADSPEPAALSARHETGEELTGFELCLRLPAMWRDDSQMERWACRHVCRAQGSASHMHLLRSR